MPFISFLTAKATQIPPAAAIIAPEATAATALRASFFSSGCSPNAAVTAADVSLAADSFPGISIALVYVLSVAAAFPVCTGTSVTAALAFAVECGSVAGALPVAERFSVARTAVVKGEVVCSLVVRALVVRAAVTRAVVARADVSFCVCVTDGFACVALFVVLAAVGSLRGNVCEISFMSVGSCGSVGAADSRKTM